LNVKSREAGGNARKHGKTSILFVYTERVGGSSPSPPTNKSTVYKRPPGILLRPQQRVWRER
jgi:hypothetical protein